MCAILDANVTNTVFSSLRSGAADGFYEWLRKRGALVYSTQFLEAEFFVQSISLDAKIAIRQFLSSGVATIVSPAELNKEREFVSGRTDVLSKDTEILALARASGARLLFTNDRDLQKDFRNHHLISNPRGRIYTTLGGRTSFSSHHQGLLARDDLCSG